MVYFKSISLKNLSTDSSFNSLTLLVKFLNEVACSGSMNDRSSISNSKLSNFLNINTFRGIDSIALLYNAIPKIIPIALIFFKLALFLTHRLLFRVINNSLSLVIHSDINWKYSFLIPPESTPGSSLNLIFNCFFKSFVSIFCNIFSVSS
ncbi:hypothetical protein A0H76_402 [Hepatospora eriocheir]|uniref:Uncharacterized protein n=1 Tax=Hepatospora eriocheir TaxID=1081669 RepID=A0A1X0QJ19_9MICR|nr:hypothetical protein A0H76_402 [Hepatospora eriocheir]